MFGIKSNMGKTMLGFFIAVIMVTSIITLVFSSHIAQTRQSDKQTAVFLLDKEALESFYINKTLSILKQSAMQNLQYPWLI